LIFLIHCSAFVPSLTRLPLKSASSDLRRGRSSSATPEVAFRARQDFRTSLVSTCEPWAHSGYFSDLVKPSLSLELGPSGLRYSIIDYYLTNSCFFFVIRKTNNIDIAYCLSYARSPFAPRLVLLYLLIALHRISILIL
jgi:hypothetical protein